MNIGETVEIKNYGFIEGDFNTLINFNTRRNRQTTWGLNMIKFQGAVGKIIDIFKEDDKKYSYYNYPPASKYKLYYVHFSNGGSWWFYEDDIAKKEELE